ncbi:type II toxin-antitoxin system RelE/ParE family toxin [Luteolibacter luteus]|uniref:Type II toxin-antitoxin system RelE/ParE family toxin n=1 Tax=Luteolibacter luteus TaxID=2728835 RepID=A0A858RSB2_9BACT|nr:type II toxin-antitoxin system RelE/ParE family toxin [Luteolibacter luteus]
MTKAAIADLQSIREYTLERWDKEQETTSLKALWAKFQQIQETPGRFRHREDLFKGCQLAAEGRVSPSRSCESSILPWTSNGIFLLDKA